MEPALKQRLIGAAVLVALAVIFLPMLIKGPAPESGMSDVSLDLPARSGGDGMETRELPLLAPGETPQGGAVGLPGAQTGDGRLPVVDTADSTGGMMPAPAAGGDYAVTFGSYASTADAARVVEALRSSQLPGFQESARGNDGRTLHRVRIGPYASRADAEAARLRAAHVRDDVGSRVIALDAGEPASSASPTAAPGADAVRQEPLADAAPAPAAPKPAAKPEAAESKPAKPVATTPPAPAPPPAGASGVGFAVQLGAFSNAAEAIKLRDRVRALGHAAFTEQVNTDQGTLNRVLAGPVGSREDAERLKSKISASIGINGLVRSHP
ncbi:SPOR domain-containing protein [Lysobacter sp. A3-1-A15]|uniref:SPOR domain-containing protein n=1 Tax=Novilysobacter viscosus TaxID=3098602 RepID=UPI002EDA1CB5